MLNELKFVQGAVARKDLVPAMTHFRIEDGFVRGFNGTMALNSPIPFEINCNPKASQLVKAIAQCTETVTLSMTQGNRLRIQSGKFRAFVDTIDGDTPHPQPEGQEVAFDGEQFLTACKVLYDFIGDDASRQWTNGILLSGSSAFATNNTTLLEYWLGDPFPFVINIPRACIREVIRIGESPTHAQITDHSITIHYTDGRWIRSQLFETTWPDLAKILDKPSDPKPIPEEFFDGLEVLKKMSDGSNNVYLSNGLMRTHQEEFTGGTYEVDGIDFQGCYNIAKLSLLRNVLDRIDFSGYPGPCMFFGDRVRGAIIGLRM